MKDLHPNFISNRAVGIDLYDGKSQEHLAKAICSHITRIDSQYPDEEQPVIPRLIGLEGPWGCGKSNVVAQMEEQMKDKYLFFTYDAWGHQEDLQRRSLLEQLTSALIGNPFFKQNTKLSHLVENKETHDLELKVQNCTWEDRLHTLVARKSYTRNYSYPKLNNDSKWFALLLLLLGFSISFANGIKCDGLEHLYKLLVFVPLIFFFLYLYFMGRNLKKEGAIIDVFAPIKQMWAFYSTNTTSDTTSYSISQLEPSEREFREWMQDLNDSLLKDKHLVIVFDNMDRLPSDKVKQLWSSINTFFAENGYSKIWCLIPFDKKHLASAFCGEAKKEDIDDKNHEGSNNENITSLFIEKTFPIVYRVSSPVETDFKGMFQKLFRQAFSEEIADEATLNCISTIYRIVNVNPNARHIITYINKLVACYNQWGKNIHIEIMGLFLLYRDEILSHPEQAILENAYFNDATVQRQFSEFTDIQTEMAALSYGVEKEQARQLPLKRYLQNALSTGGADNIQKYASEDAHFYEVLLELIKKLDISTQYNNTIKVLDLLEDDVHLSDEWKLLVDYYKICYSNEYTPFEIPYIKILLLHIQQEQIDNFCHYIFTEHLNPNNLKGYEIYELLDGVKHILKGRNIAYDFPKYSVPAPVFLDFVNRADCTYRDYPIAANQNEFTQQCLEKIEGGDDLSHEFSLLVNDERFSFKEVNAYLKSYVASSDSEMNRVQASLAMLKILNRGPIEFPKLDTNHLDRIWDQMDSIKDAGYIDLFVLLSINGVDVSVLPDKLQAGLNEVLLKYSTIKGLIDCYKQYQTSACRSILAYCVDKNIFDDSCPDDGLVTDIAYLANHLGYTCGQIINYLNGWGYVDLGSTDKTVVLSSIFSSNSIADAVIGQDNPLGHVIDLKFIDELEQCDISEFINSGNHTFRLTSYWGNVLRRLVEKKEIQTPLSHKMIEIASKLLLAIEHQNLTSLQDGSVEKFLLDKVEFKDVSTTVYNIAKDFVTGQVTITPSAFTLLHRFVEQTNQFEVNYEGFMNQCMIRLINNSECQNIILGNKEFYANIMRGRLDKASELKKMMEEIVVKKDVSNKQFHAFCVELMD